MLLMERASEMPQWWRIGLFYYIRISKHIKFLIEKQMPDAPVIDYNAGPGFILNPGPAVILKQMIREMGTGTDSGLI